MLWIAVNPEDQPTPLRFQTPYGEIAAEQFTLGRIEWQAPSQGEQKIVIETLTEPVGLMVPDGVPIEWAVRQR